MKKSLMFVVLLAVLGLISLGTGPTSLTMAQSSTPSWTTKASMPTGRENFSVGVVNGKIYAIGGWDGSSTFNTVEEYDPETDKWTTKAPIGSSRGDLAVAVVKDKIYVIGGLISAGYTIGSVEEYDPATNQSTRKASMPTSRTNFAVGVVNDKIYVIGAFS